jgi:hypothetical protein
MRPLLVVTVAGWSAIASACSTAPSPEPVVKLQIVRPQLPAAARQPCAAPVALQDRSLAAAEVTAAWGRDRAALRICETRRSAAVAAVDGVER